ncbi:DUF5819 family protein [Streptomyces sp. AC555_RSS877]|uniref:DUF5819 family protein n=1 Tax=Streptomyces sp. AC555_RSS877 TaxID=2823688 RepID=UPI001C25F45F|nr:DUF5819 family protein [Streptomyces sp. AC555_RSS877]
MDVHDGGSNALHGPGEPGAAPAGPPAPQASSPGPAPTHGRPADTTAHGRPSAHEQSSAQEQPSAAEPPHAAEPESGTGPVSAAASGPEPPARAAYAPHAAEQAHATLAPSAPPGPRTGVAALSLRYRIVVAVALAVVGVAVCVHIGMVFLHVAPSNTVTKQHGRAIDDWIYPEFEQNWKLFAPNPLQQNIAVQVRAQIDTADGGTRTTGWYDLSAEDGRAIDGNLLPSHTQQNELRRAWDFFVATHGGDNRAMGLRGSLSETYLRRIVLLRLDREEAAGKGEAIDLVQIRSRTTNVRPPRWSDEKVSDQPVYRVLPWWSIPAESTEGDAE